MTLELDPLWPGFAYKDHQITGIRWLQEREAAAQPGGILCDEMGLGKTIQMVGLIKNGTNTCKQTLLVAPVAVLEQWAAVVERSGMRVARPRGKAAGWEMSRDRGAVHVCMIGYEMAARHPLLLAAYDWDRVIYDEAHRLASGNKSTEIATSIKGIKWLLTATPIVNRIKDLSTLLEIVGIKTPVQQLEAMAPVIKTYVMARSMDQLRATMPDAPPKPAYHTQSLDFATEDEGEFYRCMTGVIRKRWKRLDSEGGAGAALEKLQMFMRLRQLSLHPQVYIAGRKKALGKLYARPDWEGSSTKFEAIKKLVAGGGNWIVFCHFHREMEMLQELLKPVVAGPVQIYSGAQTAAQKSAVLAATHGVTGPQVLLVQLQSGGVGLNLQHFNRVLFTGPWWTKALMDQAVGRAVRIGQREVVQVFNICLKEEETLNIDKYMHEKAAEKGDLCKKVLESANTNITST